MRTLLYILIGLMVSGWFSTASAEDLFLGRVLSVDRDAGRLTVRLIEESDGRKAEDGTGKSVQVFIHPARMPQYLSSGRLVRIWADMSMDSGALNATRLYALNDGAGGKDPTGVRRRIGKSRGRYGGKGAGRGHGRH
ncbi:MAG: hypothetical protein JRL30_28795 [Deltaproteobacteria bacterium]|nr:hypothetical protein [Deltaproteobacteria bacterium]